MKIGSKELSQDIIIIGAGIIGLSIAYHLLQRDPKLSITVLEKDTLLGLGSTGKCTGGINYQFRSPQLRRLSLLSREFFQTFDSVFNAPSWYKEKGYLMLVSEEELWDQLQRAAEQAVAEGIPVKIFSRQELIENFPYLHREGFGGGSLCAWDAYADPYAVQAELYSAVRRKGAEVFFDREVTKLIKNGDTIQGVEIKGEEISCGLVVNAAGPYAAHVAAMAGISLPVQPYRRQVYVCTNPKDVPKANPTIVDLASGFYMHQEASGKTVLLGGTDRETWPGLADMVDKSAAEKFFLAAMDTIPSVINVKWLRTYTGICEQTPDFHPILGYAPGLSGLFLANGFSGHGFMHAPAAGQIAADLILTGSTELIDVELFHPQRFFGNIQEPFLML
ncbi:glycine/D-amino acid oxidase, deaminating [Desulfosporosinus orientis DSM 765]|uniref:Glycine/D-amino acid oxidase, deaminating n=1 Tax=Desulfosporosinus orientis (strain ATCC 19365 / DSM 765 / NCIMB 8382 / VKM B-1628 / Singapore I) TaxID=768706 RepID=G7WCH6_DESOD|nr:FAD-binding oxidoreductase [Desulfosporosinus orientis]AET66298.1 glycine/D-amino acid oxidase, deaminating [Desulfosporosinus orientis DSM 765]